MRREAMVFIVYVSKEHGSELLLVVVPRLPEQEFETLLRHTFARATPLLFCHVGGRLPVLHTLSEIVGATFGDLVARRLARNLGGVPRGPASGLRVHCRIADKEERERARNWAKTHVSQPSVPYFERTTWVSCGVRVSGCGTWAPDAIHCR